jgi:hypothetical protein
MQIVYYFDKGSGICPVKKYLEQYYIDDHDTPKRNNRKRKLLADIAAKIDFLARSNGIPIPPISKPLHGYSYFEIRQRKDKAILIRIFYFCNNSKIVLLNAIEKPDNYDTYKETHKIKKLLDITQIYQNNFINNPNSYEEYS